MPKRKKIQHTNSKKSLQKLQKISEDQKNQTALEIHHQVPACPIFGDSRKSNTPDSKSNNFSLFKRCSQTMRRIRGRWRHILREQRNQRFPESERLPIQLLLLFWGLIPIAREHVQNITRNWKMQITRSISRPISYLEAHPIQPRAFLSASFCLISLILFFSVYTFGTTVRYNNKIVGSLSSHQDAQAAQNEVERVTAHMLGHSYAIADDLLQYNDGLVRREDLIDQTAFAGELSHELGVVNLAYALYINGEFIGATPYQGALEELIRQLQAIGTDENTISCTFQEDIEIRQEYVPTQNISNLGYLAESLFRTKIQEVSYVVTEGDTWSTIAEKHQMTSEELQVANPDFTAEQINQIKSGDVLIIRKPMPYLTRVLVQQKQYTEPVPYDYHDTDSDRFYQGNYKIISPGECGTDQVTANITYVNGQETKRDILSRVRLKNPVAEERFRGISQEPTGEATGIFQWPVLGRLSSGFGGRDSPGGVGSTNHKGLDIAVPYGTPICAADSGTVTYAGWMRGYGNVVFIDHHNGYETRYAHNSSLTISVGQHVYQGQQIACAGSTGNSTGNHCHFEVRFDGEAHDPVDYLPQLEQAEQPEQVRQADSSDAPII